MVDATLASVLWQPATEATAAQPAHTCAHANTHCAAAVRALAESGLAVGISAAGIIGSCNPADAGYQAVFGAAGNGSWLGLIPGKPCRQLELLHLLFPCSWWVADSAADFHKAIEPPLSAEASHSQFADGGCIVNGAADVLCGRGRDSRREVTELTATPLLAWLWDQMVGQQAPAPALAQQQEVSQGGEVGAARVLLRRDVGCSALCVWVGRVARA